MTEVTETVVRGAACKVCGQTALARADVPLSTLHMPGGRKTWEDYLDREAADLVALCWHGKGRS